MFARSSFILDMYLCGVARKSILIVFDKQGVSRSSVDEIKFKNIINMQANIIKNTIRLTCINIGIVLITFLLINEIIKEYIKAN